MDSKFKIIFMDFDGCLNSGKYFSSLNEGFDDPINQLDPVAISRLNKITDATGAKIVVSSTWRLAFINREQPLTSLQNCLKSYGITGEIIDMTPNKPNAVRNRRGKEIQSWIDAHYSLIEKFVIIDDDPDMGRLRNKQILTKFEDGLLDDHVEKIINLLGRET
jgi:histidinol phosphatase-like enzyme